MIFKTAKCERTNEQILLSDGYLVCNASTGEWSFISIDAEGHNFDYEIQLDRIVNSPEALIDWMAHLQEKSWFNPIKFFQFFDRFRRENNLYGSL